MYNNDDERGEVDIGLTKWKLFFWWSGILIVYWLIANFFG
jgi:hypothetical protein